jgi:enamine deaminase RidA (YjgF/YER057c/UK114 family)
MDKRPVNPWTWQDALGFAQAWQVDGARSIIFMAGQVAMSPDGEVVAPGDVQAQTRQAFENLGTVLEQAGASYSDIVKLTFYLTDIGALRDAMGVRDEFIDRARPPASTAVGVAGLARPDLVVEVDAIAVT